jgi:hypothetical protein
MTEKFTCPCCGHRTLEERYAWDICPVCFWEDDILEHEDGTSGANGGMLLSQAQTNFILLGACDPEMKRNVRPPKPDEPLDPAWKPFPKALELVRQARTNTNGE